MADPPTQQDDLDKLKGILNRNKYEMLRKLGEGGFASAFEVRKRDTGERFACKIVNRKAIVQKFGVTIDMLVREPEISSRFQHPNIIRVTNAWRAEGYLFTLMELCSGGSVENVIYPPKSDRGNPIEINQAVTWFCHVASGMYYIHSKLFAHRDIKPDNIFLTANQMTGQAKLADFGFVTAIENEKRKILSDTPCGTAQYRSPETYGTAVKYDAAQADVWALGMTFFEMISGYYLFDHADEEKKLELKKECGIKWMSQVPPKVVRVLVRKMLEPDPLKRINSRDVITYIDKNLIVIF